MENTLKPLQFKVGQRVCVLHARPELPKGQIVEITRTWPHETGNAYSVARLNAADMTIKNESYMMEESSLQDLETTVLAYKIDWDAPTQATSLSNLRKFWNN